MKRLLALVLLSVMTIVGLRACSSRASVTQQASNDAPRTTAGRIAQGHALVQQRQYDRAIDTFVQLAADDSVRSQAIVGAGEALTRKASAQRVPERIDSAAELAKRLPAEGGSRRQLRSAITTLLVDPVVVQVHQAEALLENRRAFVESMRDDDEGDVMPTPSDRRVLTENEVVAARKRMPELGVSPDIVKLYRYERPLAAAMDRFLADDERYLGEEEVSDNALDEVEESCYAMAEALWPVQRQLDRVRPGWRRE